MVKVEGDEFLYLGRAQIARKALESPDYIGSWVNGPDGSYFHLKRKTDVAAIESTAHLQLAIPESVPAGKVSVLQRAKEVNDFDSLTYPRKTEPRLHCPTSCWEEADCRQLAHYGRSETHPHLLRRKAVYVLQHEREGPITNRCAHLASQDLCCSMLAAL
jgi:hypothetical protein